MYKLIRRFLESEEKTCIQLFGTFSQSCKKFEKEYLPHVIVNTNGSVNSISSVRLDS